MMNYKQITNMFEEIQNHNSAVAAQIQKGFGVDIEKGHSVGDVKVVDGKTFIWTEYSPGKFDWRQEDENKKKLRAEYQAELSKKSKMLDELKTIGSDFIHNAVKESKVTWRPEYGDAVTDSKEIADLISDGMWGAQNSKHKATLAKTMFDYLWDSKVANHLRGKGIFNSGISELKESVREMVDSKAWVAKQKQIASVQANIDKYKSKLHIV